MLRRLGSLKLTLVLLLLLAVAVLIAYQAQSLGPRSSRYAWITSLPLTLLTLNLVAAIVSNASFRAQPALLVFHLCLLALALLAGIGQLTNLKAHTEVTTGGWFEGELLDVQAGPLHPGHYRKLRFRNLGFRIDYAPGPSRRHTFNRILTLDEQGKAVEQVVGDQVPLVLEGYRFYTSFNKGFAPEFVWRGPDGLPRRGVVHLPAWPEHEFNQANEWTPPGARTPLWIALEFEEEILKKDAPSEFHPPSDYRLIVRVGDERYEIRPGEPLQLPEGTLMLLGLRTWMGYSVFYDQTRYWMLAAALLAVVSLGWHFWQKFGRSDWRRARE